MNEKYAAFVYCENETEEQQSQYTCLCLYVFVFKCLSNAMSIIIEMYIYRIYEPAKVNYKTLYI